MSSCFHCLEPIPAGLDLRARVRGDLHAVCCIGCRAAAEWIAGLGLDDYYRVREAPAPRAHAVGDYAGWDRPGLARLHVRSRDATHAEVVVLVDGLRCAACAWLIERAIGALDGLHEIGVNTAARRVVLVFDPTVAPLSTLLAALGRLGYAAHPLTAEAIDAARRRETRDALKRLVVAGLGAMQAMMYAVALYAGVFDGIDPAVRDFFRWLGFLVATPVVLYAAQPFFAGAWREARARRLSMDTPVALAIAAIYVASLVETLRGGHEIYFDSVSMFVLFLLAGRFVEMRARHRAGDVVDAFARLQPALAELVAGDATEIVGVHELVPGDVVRVAVGTAVPADGELAGMACRIDESLVSGESTPRRRVAGEAVVAGSIVVEGPAEVVVRRTGADTVLAGIVRLVTRAASERPRLARLADARAARFVARVFALTALTALAWSWIDPSRAFAASLAVLVVSCPCAFALAVPAALTRAVAVLARRGVLVVDADALEALARVDHIVFDKTGTLTEPAIDVAAIEVLRGTRAEAIAKAAALEEGSAHPLAAALRRAADVDAGLRTVEARDEVAAAGVEAIVDGVRHRLGRAGFALGIVEAGHADAMRDDEGDALVLADVHGVIARFPVVERVRGRAEAMLEALRADGVGIALVSGDAATRVAVVANRLGIADWRAAAHPGDKLDHLRALRARGHVVAMVGDGANDAPVLAGADVAIAIGEGASLAHASSGILLATPRLEAIAEARAVAQRMLVTLRRNLAWALGYNLSVVPLAALGFVPPWLAAIGMSASSVVVLLHSLRIDVPATNDASGAAHANMAAADEVSA
ncbi:heavy metal translocating P-type ATPase [Dokdonella sp. MW10]|uniref:heavy metal translocating P-type ATPase n=1 Tax=Dokdonella sp. MW10 TaxID=2992926 RepID=UPI003F807D64